MNKTIIIFAIIAVLSAGAGFWGGMQYQRNLAQSNFREFANDGQGSAENRHPGDANNVRRGQGGGFINGQIVAKDDNSITVQLPSGGSKIVLYSGSTQILKMAAGVTNDLAVGQSVMVQGSANQDGSVSAQSIQLRPESPDTRQAIPPADPGSAPAK